MSGPPSPTAGVGSCSSATTLSLTGAPSPVRPAYSFGPQTGVTRSSASGGARPPFVTTDTCLVLGPELTGEPCESHNAGWFRPHPPGSSARPWPDIRGRGTHGSAGPRERLDDQQGLVDAAATDPARARARGRPGAAASDGRANLADGARLGRALSGPGHPPGPHGRVPPLPGRAGDLRAVRLARRRLCLLPARRGRVDDLRDVPDPAQPRAHGPGALRGAAGRRRHLLSRRGRRRMPCARVTPTGGVSGGCPTSRPGW